MATDDRDANAAMVDDDDDNDAASVWGLDVPVPDFAGIARLIQNLLVWRTSPGFEYAASPDGRPRVSHGGVEPQKQRTYLRLGLVATSAATLNFELRILILLVAMEKKMPIIHFRLTPLVYMTGTKSLLIVMNVRWC